MDFPVCVQCSKEIEDKGIMFRNRHFCSDECCEEFEELYQQEGEPNLETLEVEEVVVEDLEELENLNPDETDDCDDLDDPEIDIDDF